MFQTLYTYKCTKGSCLCSFMCVFVGMLLFNILNSFWVVDGADRLFHLQLCYEILFLLRCGSCQIWSLVNRLNFPDFWTRPYTYNAPPPHAPAPPALRQRCASALRCNALQISRWFKDQECIQLKEKILQWIQRLRRSWILIQNRFTMSKWAKKGYAF